SIEAAQKLYGVVIADHQVDETATELTRSRLREERGEKLQPGPTTSLGHGPRDGAVHPFRENIEVRTGADGEWVQCAQCGQRFGPAEADGTAMSARARREPTVVGARMAPLTGAYQVEQLFCPSCSALLNTDVVDAQ